MLFSAQAVFFDAGFTLLFPSVPVHEAYLREAAALGAAAPPDEFLIHFGACWKRWRESELLQTDLSTDAACERKFWHDFTSEVASPFPALREVHQEWLKNLVAWFDSPASWKLAPGTRELLTELRAANIQVGIISNWHSALHGILDGHDLKPLLDILLISVDHGFKKPHPSIFQSALEQCGVGPEHAVHVGDSPIDDVKGAQALGMSAVLVSASESTREDGVLTVPCVDVLRHRE